ncbi:MAG: hypothetical protein RLZZ08_1014 [Pseudomonadota bacterium]|jgi:uncharacterized membrane protein YeiH
MIPPPALPPLFDLAGTAVFALSGALVAARLRQTFVTMTFFALVTGVGGGSLRDALIGQPAFWLHQPWVAAVILAAATLAWFTPKRWWETRLLEWADAIGLAVFSVLGTAKAIAFGVDPLPAIILGVVSGCMGGIVRDVLAGLPSILMRPELYVTAAALGATLCALGLAFNLPPQPVWAAAAIAAFVLRGAALVWAIELPAYSRAG